MGSQRNIPDHPTQASGERLVMLRRDGDRALRQVAPECRLGVLHSRTSQVIEVSRAAMLVPGERCLLDDEPHHVVAHA